MEIQREIELEKIKHDIVHAQGDTKSESKSERFDSAKNIRLVQNFQKKLLKNISIV